MDKPWVSLERFFSTGAPDLWRDGQPLSVSYRKRVVVQQQKGDASQTHHHSDERVLVYLFCAARRVQLWIRPRRHHSHTCSGQLCQLSQLVTRFTEFFTPITTYLLHKKRLSSVLLEILATALSLTSSEWYNEPLLLSKVLTSSPTAWITITGKCQNILTRWWHHLVTSSDL